MSPQVERRLVTALFIDVVGSSALTVELGPERLKGLLDRTFRELGALIAREGGTVEKYVGDAIHALFGAPTAHADDPLRALRAAQACLAWVAGQTHAAVPIAVRAGVETGEAIVDLAATRDRREQMSVGTCVSVAARLQQLADPGQVLVGPVCRDAAGEAAVLDPLGEVELKGLGRLSAWRLAGLHAARARARLPFVGREAELDLLELAYRRARAGRSLLALVTGPPGQGKTRLVEEFLARCGGEALTLAARCRPPGEAGAASPLLELAAAAPSAGALEASLGDRIPELAERRRVAAAVAHSAGIETSEGLARLSVAERQDEIVSAWRRYLVALARERPLVVWVEDLHWADPEVIRILDRASGGAGARLLVVATARPEFAEQARLRPGGDRIFVELDALDPDAARALARHAGGTDEATLARAEGNPLFVIELARSRAPGTDPTVPLTLQGVIGARLDELAPEDRDLLQRAAVIGESLSVPSVALVTGRLLPETGAALERLADLLYLQPAPAGYRYHHPLVRDVAYGRLPTRERMHLHARYAREGVAADDVETLAHHLWDALAPPDAGWVWEGSVELPDLRDRARAALQAAGRRHAERFATQPAMVAYERALHFADRPGDRAPIEHAMGAALAADGRGDLAWAHYLAARDLYREAGGAPPELYADLAELAAWTPGMFQRLPDAGVIGALIEEGEALARRVEAGPALARLLVTRALRGGERAAVEEALRLFDAAEDPRPFAPVLLLTGALQVWWGDFRDAGRTYERIDRLLNAGVQVDQADEYRIGLALQTGRLAEAEAIAVRFLGANAARGPHLRTHAYREHAQILLARGDWSALLRVAEEVERTVRDSPGTAFCYAVTTARALAAVSHALLGRPGDAGGWLERAETRLTSLPLRHEEVLLLAYGALGRRAEALALRAEVRARHAVVPHAFCRTETVILTMLERWDDLDRPLGTLEAAAAAGSDVLAALVTAVREERDAARGGPPPAHAALRALGYAGWSALLRHRPDRA